MYLVYYLYFIIILNNKVEKKNKLINNVLDLVVFSFIICSKREKGGGNLIE